VDNCQTNITCGKSVLANFPIPTLAFSFPDAWGGEAACNRCTLSRVLGSEGFRVQFTHTVHARNPMEQMLPKGGGKEKMQEEEKRWRNAGSLLVEVEVDQLHVLRNLHLHRRLRLRLQAQNRLCPRQHDVITPPTGTQPLKTGVRYALLKQISSTS
jgi:hypothetical protein